jgi:hypothetical protein
VEDKPDGVPLTRTHHRHTVTDWGGRPPTGRANGTLASGEHEPVALRQRGGGAAGLGARTLLEEQELSAGVTGAGLVEVDHNLQRKDPLTVEVTMQGVPISGPVLEQQRSRLRLTGTMATVQPFLQRLRPRGFATQLVPPVPGDR